MLGEHHGDACREFLGVFHIQKFIGTMRIGMRPQHARDEELRTGKLPSQHAHEGDRPAAAGMHRVASVHRARGAVDRLRQPWREGRGIPAAGTRVCLERHDGPVGRIALELRSNRPGGCLRIAGRRQPQR